MTTATLTTIGTFTTEFPIADYANFDVWSDYDLTSIDPSEDFESLDGEILSFLIRSVRNRLVIDVEGHSYIGNGQTIYHYSFSY